MDPELARQIAAVEDRHWWFVGRRRILKNVISRLSLPSDATLMDVGCGSGGNLAMLAGCGHLVAVESDEFLRAQAQRRRICDVLAGSLPDELPFPSESFTLITLLDVLEHIEDESAALEALRDRLRPNGQLLVTVPAYEFLWSEHDERNAHLRRYTKRSLVVALTRAGLAVDHATYFNTLLFPIAATARLADRWLHAGYSSDLAIPPTPVNRLLTGLFALERQGAASLSMPFGLSVLAIGRLS